MTYKVQHLTNNAYGFPRGKTRRVKPVALICVHITGNKSTASYTDLHKAAQAERNYANRSGSGGPSAHYYVARDGWAIEAINWRKYAAWSNGDVKSPDKTNTGIKRVLALRSKGYNANEAYWLEIEAVGHDPSGHHLNGAQRQFIAERVAEAAQLSGMNINRNTVHGHFMINSVDRQNCPCPKARHDVVLDDIINRAKNILNPPVDPTPPEDVVQSYSVPKEPSVIAIPTDVWLYHYSDFRVLSNTDPTKGPVNIKVNPGRDLPYFGSTDPVNRVVEYVGTDGKHSGKSYFVKATDAGTIKPAPDDTPYSEADLANAKGDAARGAASDVKGAAVTAANKYGA